MAVLVSVVAHGAQDDAGHTVLGGDLEANNFDYAAVKAKGLQRTEGKEYVVNDGDVIEFLFNV